MTKILKITLLTITLSLILTACGQRQIDRYKDTIYELTRSDKNRNIKGNEGDLDDLRGCPILFKMSNWEKDGRDQSWMDGTMYHGTGVSLDLPTKRGYKNLNMILQDKSQYLIYLGPWRQVILKHEEGSFLNKKEITEQKQIRFFAYYPKEGGRIEYQYESMTEENKNIPEKKFSLSPTAKYAPDKFGLCVVKWTAKYGYNAVADLHKNPWFPFFTREYLTGSGKIIDSETGKIIADEKGNLVKSNIGE